MYTIRQLLDMSEDEIRPRLEGITNPLRQSYILQTLKRANKELALLREIPSSYKVILAQADILNRQIDLDPDVQEDINPAG